MIAPTPLRLVHGESGSPVRPQPLIDVVTVNLAEQMSGQHGQADRQAQVVSVAQDRGHAIAVIPVDGFDQGDDIARIIAGQPVRRARGLDALEAHGPHLAIGVPEYLAG